jgi:hypothetical protein
VKFSRATRPYRQDWPTSRSCDIFAYLQNCDICVYLDISKLNNKRDQPLLS